MSPLHYLALLFVAVFVTRVSMPLVIDVAWRLNLVDMPGGRKVHDHPVPRAGGIAMFLGISVAAGLQMAGEAFWGWEGMFITDGSFDREVVGILVGALIMFAVGLVDDFRNLSPLAKFAGQMLAATVVVWSGTLIEFVGNPFGGGLLYLGTLSLPVTFVYILGFTNVINLIDGLDGLAGGISTIAAASMFLVAAQLNRLDAAVLAIVLIGACAAFLRFNFHPASVFMGDSGSLVLGYLLAVISLLGVMRSTATIALLVPLIIIGVPILDTASAIVRRLRGNRPIQEADRGHIHHRLLSRGFNQRQTVLIVWAWSAALAAGGYVVSGVPSGLKMATFAVLIVLSVLLAYWLGIWEVVYHHDGGDEDRRDTR